MNSSQLERMLKKQGIMIENRNGTGHKMATNPKNGKITTIPRHGGRQEISKGLVHKIMKDLGL